VRKNMKIITQPSGELEMTADLLEQEFIRELRRRASNEVIAEDAFIVKVLGTLCYEQVAPKEVGALTAAPIISNGTGVYGFMEYQITNFLAELAKGATVTWMCG
jgi:hypothetical protein